MRVDVPTAAAAADAVDDTSRDHLTIAIKTASALSPWMHIFDVLYRNM